MFDPAWYGYPLTANFNRGTLESLLKSFEDAVKRESDRRLAEDLRREVFQSDPAALTLSTLKRLARWCKTDGIYGDGMMIAQRISELLFGRIVDRQVLGT